MASSAARGPLGKEGVCFLLRAAGPGSLLSAAQPGSSELQAQVAQDAHADEAANHGGNGAQVSGVARLNLRKGAKWRAARRAVSSRQGKAVSRQGKAGPGLRVAVPRAGCNTSCLPGRHWSLCACMPSARCCEAAQLALPGVPPEEPARPASPHPAPPHPAPTCPAAHPTPPQHIPPCHAHPPPHAPHLSGLHVKPRKAALGCVALRAAVVVVQLRKGGLVAVDLQQGGVR